MRKEMLMVLAMFVVPVSAMASETWLCNFPDAPGTQPEAFVLHDKIVERLGPNGTGGPIIPLQILNVLMDNEKAISAAATSTSPSVGGMTEVDTLMIERATGRATQEYVVTSGPADKPHRGFCQKKISDAAKAP